MKTITARIAEELSVHERQVEVAVRLLDEGATVPFIARGSLIKLRGRS